MGAAADAARAKFTGGGTAAKAARAGSGGGGSASAAYQHPTGGAKAGRNFLAEQAPKVGPTGVWTPVREAFDWLSQPSYAVGNLIRGKPLEAQKNVLNLVMPGTSHSKNLAGAKVFPSQVLRDKGVLPGGTLGAGLGFLIDAVTDPTTYLTFGATTPLRETAKVGAQAVAKEAALRAEQRLLEITAQGRKATPKELAEIMAEKAAVDREVPKRFSASIRVPFTRGKGIEIFGSERVPAFFGGLGERLPEKLRGVDEVPGALSKVIGENRGISKTSADVYNAVRNNAGAWRRQFQRDARTLNAQILKAEKGLPNIGRGELGQRIAMHLDNPEKYPLGGDYLPAEVSPLVEKAAKIRDDLDALEEAAGIEKGKRLNYVPHVLAKQRDRAAFERAFGQTPGGLDNPFFVRARTTDTLDDFIEAGKKHGFTPELNIAKILERRIAASFKAQEKKALDDAFTGQHGLKPPEQAVPDVGAIKGELRREQDRLRLLTSREGALAEQADAASARKALTEAHAAVRAAQRTGDPVAVTNARERLAAAQAQSSAAREAARRGPADVANLQQWRRRMKAEVDAIDARLAGVAEGDVDAGVVRAQTRRENLLDRMARVDRLTMAKRIGPADEAELASLTADVAPIAEGELDRIARRTSLAVKRAEKRVATAKRGKSKAAIRDAEANLRRARANERRAAIALGAARRNYGGSARNIVAQTKRVVKKQRQLDVAEKRAGALEIANARLRARPGNFAASKEEYELAKETWREIGDATKYHEGTLLPPQIHEDLERVHAAIARTVKDEAGLAAVGRFMANLGARWKALALLSPGYHIRNQMDDGWRAWVAGAHNPLTYGQAAKIVPKPRFRASTPDEVIEEGGRRIKLGKREMTRKELVDQAESLGVINTGFVPSEIGSSMDTIQGGIGSHLPGRGRLVRASSELGNYRENTMRMFVFMERLKAGDSLVEAAEKVQKHLFDYGQVSNFVETARRFWIPFITFPSKAIPYTAKLAASRPGTFANLNKAMYASNVASGNPDLSQLPPWLRQGFAVPIPDSIRNRAAGLLGPPDQPLIFNPERVSSWSSLNLLDPRPKEAFSNIVGGMVNPMVVTPLEVASGFDTFFVNESSPKTKQGPLVRFLTEHGIPVPGGGQTKTDSYTGEEVPAFATWADKLASLLPIYGQASYALPNASSETPRLGPLKYFTGIPISPYDQARAAFYAEKAQR